MNSMKGLIFPLPSLNRVIACNKQGLLQQSFFTQKGSYTLLNRLFTTPSSSLQFSAQGLVETTKKINIHDSAVQRLKELQKKDKNTLYLRIEVEGGGCSGFQYKFRVENQTGEDDLIFEKDGGRVVTDKISFEFLQGATVEFEDSLMRSAFSIASNPNSEASCGCGSSFVAKMK